MYIENPKTRGSGIKCVIPQREVCTVGCADCFFRSGRSYLEPLSYNLPNIPEPELDVLYRINDGNDSSVDIDEVIKVASKFKMKYYNTSFSHYIDRFDAPVVLTINPGEMTDKDFTRCDSKNLMFVRFRCNTWNFGEVGKPAIMWYAEREIPIVLTFMAYHDKESIPKHHQLRYENSKRVLNNYWTVKREEWRRIMQACEDSPYSAWVDSCGTATKHLCMDCGNCLKYYFRKLSKTT